MSEKSVRTRVNVTLTKIYVDAMNHLIAEGLYLGRGEIFLAALKLLFRQHGIEAFRTESIEEFVKIEKAEEPVETEK